MAVCYYTDYHSTAQYARATGLLTTMVMLPVGACDFLDIFYLKIRVLGLKITQSPINNVENVQMFPYILVYHMMGSGP